MKKIIYLAWMALCSFHAYGQTDTTFYKGADISWTTQLEAEGHRFYNQKGEERECTALMKELGLNAIRLRVWVDPEDGWSSKEDMLTLAKRAQANDMELMVDFHYSDVWADPAHQTIPRAWQNLSFEDLKKAVATHTRDVLLLLKIAASNLAGYKWATKPATVSFGRWDAPAPICRNMLP